MEEVNFLGAPKQENSLWQKHTAPLQVSLSRTQLLLTVQGIQLEHRTPAEVEQGSLKIVEAINGGRGWRNAEYQVI